MWAFAASAFLFLSIVTGSAFVLTGGRSRRTRVDQRLRALGRAAQGNDESSRGAATLKRAHSSIPMLQRLLGGSGAETTALELQQAGIRLRVGEYVLVRVGFGLLLFFLAVFLTRFHPLGLALGALLAAAGYALPALYVSRRRQRRIAKIETQLVEFAPMLASSLRSGFAFQQGMEVAAKQMDPPLADELTLLLSDVNLGATMDAALLDFGRRVGSTSLDMMITAILVQRSTGGNLSEILDTAAETLRERERIRGDLQTLTASQRLTGIILSLYPIAVGLVLLALLPSQWMVLFTETAGQILLGVALTLNLIGYFAMRRVMNIEI